MARNRAAENPIATAETAAEIAAADIVVAAGAATIIKKRDESVIHTTQTIYAKILFPRFPCFPSFPAKKLPLSFPMKTVFSALSLVAATTLCAAPSPTLSDEADARILERILADEKNLLDALGSDPEARRRSYEENEKRVLEIGRRYEELANRRVDDVAVMILYGKFLRRIDDRAKADRWFQKAAKLVPTLALPKHQQGVYAAEEGDFARAYQLLKEAVALEPQTAAYHFHLGEFLSIWRELLAKNNLISREKCDAEMLQAFREATRLKPADTVYLWRYGEALGDCQNPDWIAAHVVWKKLEVALKSDLDREALALQRARANIGLGWFKDAELELSRSQSPRLAASREHLKTLLAAAKKAKAENAKNLAPATPLPAPQTSPAPAAAPARKP